jgi:hypothetical protein
MRAAITLLRSYGAIQRLSRELAVVGTDGALSPVFEQLLK